MDIGETFAQPAIREVKEEKWFDIRIDRIIGIYSDPGHVFAYDTGVVRQEFSICGLPVHAPRAQRAAHAQVGSSPNRSARSQWVIRCSG
jgi:ADP-ribose pyrophosphatase YjhB (NUDIX family)